MTAPIRTHRLMGEFDQVAAAMATAREAGRLVRVRSARELPAGWVEVVAELRDTGAEDVPRQSWWRPWLTALGWLAGLAALAGVVWLAIWLVMAVIALVAVMAWLAAHLVGIAITAGALVLFGIWCAAGAGSRCGGAHCGGCRR